MILYGRPAQGIVLSKSVLADKFFLALHCVRRCRYDNKHPKLTSSSSTGSTSFSTPSGEWETRGLSVQCFGTCNGRLMETYDWPRCGRN